MVFNVGKLANGLTVVTDFVEGSKAATVGWLFRGGSDRDLDPATGKGRNGTAHFLEHMLVARPGPDGVSPAEKFDATGAEWNALTSHNRISVMMNCLPESVPLFMDALGASLANEDYTGETMDVQHRLIAREAAETGIEQQLGEFMYAQAFLGGPYGQSIHGGLEDIEAMTADDLATFHREKLLAGDMALVVSGPYSHDEAMALAEKAFGGLRPGHQERLPRPSFNMGVTGCGEAPLDRAIVRIVLPAFGLEDRREPAAKFYCDMLERTLTHKLREQGASYGGVKASSLPMPQAGLVQLTIKVAPEKAQDVLREVAGVLRSGDFLTAENLKASKLSYKTQMAFNWHNPACRFQAITSGFGGEDGFEGLEAIHERTLAVTLGDIREVHETLAERPSNMLGVSPNPDFFDSTEFDSLRREPPSAPRRELRPVAIAPEPALAMG